MFTPKTFETLYEDLRLAVLAEEGPLSNFLPMSNLYLLARGQASVLANAYDDLSSAIADSTVATASGTRLDAHTASFGVFRNQGSFAVGYVIARPRSVAVTNTTVTAFNTRFSIGSLQYVVTADTTLTGPYTLVPVQATQIGKAYDMSPGTTLVDTSGVLDATWEFVVGSALDSLNQPTGYIKGGDDAETDDELRARFIEFINSLSSGTARAIHAAVSGVTDVESFVTKQYVPAVGWFTVYVDDGTDAPSEGLMDQVRQVLDEEKALGIAYRVLPMTKQFVNLNLQILIDPQLAASANVIRDEVTLRLRDGLRNFAFGQPLYLSKISDICHSVPGVLRVITLLPSTDVIPAPEVALRVGTVTISVVF
jgi:uncharacterized phage protein gp47/JayE